MGIAELTLVAFPSADLESRDQFTPHVIGRRRRRRRKRKKAILHVRHVRQKRPPSPPLPLSRFLLLESFPRATICYEEEKEEKEEEEEGFPSSFSGSLH